MNEYAKILTQKHRLGCISVQGVKYPFQYNEHNKSAGYPIKNGDSGQLFTETEFQSKNEQGSNLPMGPLYGSAVQQNLLPSYKFCSVLISSHQSRAINEHLKCG